MSHIVTQEYYTNRMAMREYVFNNYYVITTKPSKYKKIFGKVLIVYGVLTFPLPTGSQLAILYGLKLIGITKKDITKLYRLIKYSLKQKKRLSTLKTLIF